jgi:hypothetical protein
MIRIGINSEDLSAIGTCKNHQKQKWDQIVDQSLGLAQNMSISETLMCFFEF